jgi:hypothetical protein
MRSSNRSRSRARAKVVVSRLKAFADFSESFSAISSSWKTLRGSWSASSGTGSTSTSASNYPLAVIKMARSNVTASAKSTAPGTGIALWVTDSGNWWGVVTGQNAGTDCNCQTCSTCNAYQCDAYQCNSYQCNSYQCNSYQCNSYYTVCNYWVPLTCEAYGGGNCSSYNSPTCASYNGSNCATSAAWNSYNCTRNGNQCGQCTSWNTAYCASYNSRNCASYNAVVCNRYSGGFCGSSTSYCNSASCASSSCASSSCTSSSCSSTSCSSTSYYNCNCQTCYPATIRLIRSIADTVSEVTSWTVNTLVQSLRVITSGTSITAKAYSDNNLSTQIGSDLTYSAVGATIDTQFGIVVAPSAYSQGSTLDNFSATTN